MDLAAYFRRIGYDGPRTRPTHAVLARDRLRHALSIPFENLDPYLGVASASIRRRWREKLVARRRGGWCFEQNLLLGNALRELGFEVRGSGGARPVGTRADAVTPRTHRVLWVRCDGREWLVDAGFGGQSLTGVLEMDSEAGAEHAA